jgi:large subunit ribosomal protein L15
MKLETLKPARGSHHRPKRVGFGEGSGHGGSATRGMKGQRSRRGDHRMPGFEGGQTPLLRRIPKRGFRNTAFQIPHEVVNLSALEKHFNSQSTVTPDELKKVGLVDSTDRIKILGDGTLTKVLNVEAWSFSKSAVEKIKKAGGKAVTLSPRNRETRAGSAKSLTPDSSSPRSSE